MSRRASSLWKLQTGSRVVALPVTCQKGGDVAKKVSFLEQGGSMWVFKLTK